MSRYLVLVEIDADTPLNAESRVGIALEVVRCQGRPFVRQTGVQVEPLPEVAEPHDALTCTDSSHEDCFVAQMEEPQSERRVRLNQVEPKEGA